MTQTVSEEQGSNAKISDKGMLCFRRAILSFPSALAASNTRSKADKLNLEVRSHEVTLPMPQASLSKI